MTPDLSYTTGRARVVRAHNKWDRKKKRKEVYYCCCNNAIPEEVAPIDSIWTDCCIVCNCSMCIFSNHRLL